MGYTELKREGLKREYKKNGLEYFALEFIRNSCEGLRFSEEKTKEENATGGYLGTGLKENQIPYNMQMDIDRLCLERALERFLHSGRKEDAFDVYFCYLEMFVGDYEKTREMIELLSEFEANGSGLLMKHRDHYSHSVYVFALGLAIYESNSVYRKTYLEYYGLKDERTGAHHFLKYWGLSSLFHDIGYPFELPFEQVASYFEVEGDDRTKRPYVAYRDLEDFVKLDKGMSRKISALYGRGAEAVFDTTDELFAYDLSNKLSGTYLFTREQMLDFLKNKPVAPNRFGHYMDHAYFSATVLFKKLFCELKCELDRCHIDALTAILLHNSLYKFCVAYYKDKTLNIPLKMELHPLAFMLMLCDELQCWDRTAYGRNSRKELHPMGCEFDLSDGRIHAVYLYDEKEAEKIQGYIRKYQAWEKEKPASDAEKLICLWKQEKPKLKAFSGMYEKDGRGVSDFQSDIEKIVDLEKISFHVEDPRLDECRHSNKNSFLSDSNFINLYNFAVVLNGRWETGEWKAAREAGKIEEFLEGSKKYVDSFKKLSLEYKLSNINQAKAFAGYLDVIDCFYTSRSVDYEEMEHFSEEEMMLIGPMEHRRWLQEHYDMGWVYGEPQKSERDLLRQHKDMIPGFDLNLERVDEAQADANYNRLDKAEQDKDTEPMECMLAMLKMFDGLRIYRLKKEKNGNSK